MNQIQTVIAELQSLPRESFWPVGPKTAQLLKDKVIQLNAQNVLEIGTSRGYSGLWFCDGLTQTGGHLYTVESHAERFEVATSNFAKAGVSNIVSQIKGHAPECIHELPANLKFDLALIDATKAETQDHFESIWPRLNPNGEIIIDNVQSHQEVFKPFFQYLEQNQITYEFLDIDFGLLHIKKSETN
jgi:predicted O-methyltransferase YrrM